MQTLKLGSRGAAVKALQNRLHLAEDGIFGEATETAVRAFQKEHGLTVDGVVGQQTWGKLLPCLRPITEIIVHCTATPEGKDYSVEQIRQAHLARGFSDIGYHFVVMRDGTVREGRPLGVAGAHTKGHNANSIGVSYVGGCASDGKTPKDTRTHEQRKALRDLVAELQRRFPGATVHGHYEFANKACPSFKICEL